jgi:cytochrome c oxidase assembly protein subunit 15
MDATSSASRTLNPFLAYLHLDVTSALFLRLYKYFVFCIFGLIAFGGAVRAMNAGLSCPDWPLCFGQVIPDYHPQVYFEFIHRVIAGLVSIAALTLNIKIMSHREVSSSIKWCAGAALCLLLSQVIMGGLTVILQLHDKIVAGHLALGTGFFALSLWVYLSLVYTKKFVGSAATAQGRKPALILLPSIYAQILLGGLVASNYAALVCTEFPLCHGEFIPTLQGIIGLHIIHRLGAYTLATIITATVIYVLRTNTCPEYRKWAKALLGLIFVQIGIGIANVLYLTPPLITVLHLATGVLLLSLGVRLLRLSTFANHLPMATSSTSKSK